MNEAVNATRGSATQAPIEHADLVAIIGLANETNRHAVALDVQIDDKFR